MVTLVYEKKNSVVIEKDGQRIELTESEGKMVLKRLAEIYGFKLNAIKPLVSYKYDPLSKNIKIFIHEGRQLKTYVVPTLLIAIYLRVLKSLGPGKHMKREIARLAVEEMLKHPELRDRISQYYVGTEFDFEKFFGSRADYYELFRAPILLLDKLGFVKEYWGTKIDVLEKIEEIAVEDVESILRKELQTR